MPPATDAAVPAKAYSSALRRQAFTFVDKMLMFNLQEI
jgi:hypothetical protein